MRTTSEVTFELDERTGVARTNSKSVGYLKNSDLASAKLIIGPGGLILQDRLCRRVGFKVTPEILAKYEEAAR